MSRKKTFDREAILQSINGAAAITGLSRQYILKGIADKTIPVTMVGSDYRIHMPLFLEQLEKECRQNVSEERS